MQDRYAGDIGDFVKYALLRAISPERSLGVAWYLHPNEGPSGDGRHVSYLSNTKEWRYLDADLFDALKEIVFADHRSVAAVQRACLLPGSVFADERLQVSHVPVIKREKWRHAWFERVLQELASCGLIFADPDNGLSPDDRFRPSQKKSAKSISLREANILAKDRPLIVYHHNTRRKGGHRAEIRHWQDQLPGEVYAFYWRRWSNRTFFVINADAEVVPRLKCFAKRWAGTKAELILP